MTFASRTLVNSSRFSNSSRSRLLSDSLYAFSHRAPGAVYRVCTAERGSHSRIAWAMDSGPLSLRGKAHDAADILNVLETAEGFNLSLVLEGASGAHLVGERLAKLRARA
jgi:hypothetical protein